MTLLDTERQLRGKHWEAVARELSALCRSYGEEPIYANRLWRLRTGQTEPKSYEVRALLEWCGLDSFR